MVRLPRTPTLGSAQYRRSSAAEETSVNRGERPRRGRAARLGRSDFDLLRDAERVVDLDTEVPDGAFEFRVSEQQLDRSQIAGLLVNLRRLGAPHRMRSIS